MDYDPYRPGEYIPADGYKVGDVGPAAPRKKKRFWPRIVALCLICAMVGGAGGIAAGACYFDRNGVSGAGSTTLYESNRAPTAVEVSYTNTGKELSMEEIYASWVNSTVGISTEIVTTNYFGQQVSATAGSGFVLSADGYILTNYHVIDGARTIRVTFYDGSEYDATLVGGEETNDVAVLKITAAGLTPVIIGSSDDLRVGQAVTAIGNPLGELTFSQTAGIISALDRTVTVSGGAKMNMIQTDCTINSGNSGGPLFNTYGEVIGITSAKYSNNGSSSEATIEGIGFAIPINDVIGMVKDIISYGYVTGKPSMGILPDDVDAAAQRYGIPAGAEVLAVLDGSCAQRAGLRAGDIITSVGETPVAGVSQLQSALKSYRAGDTMPITVYRDGTSVSLQLTLDENDQARAEAMDALQEEYSNSQRQTQQSSNGSSFGWPFGWPFGW